MTDQIQLLEIEGVDPPGDAARDVIDPDKVRELADSIRSSGLLQPILVRPLNGRYEVVAGHRRYLAHRLLGEVKIASIVRVMSDEEVLLVRTIENDQREDLNPIEKAKGYRKLQEKFGWNPRQIAAKVGRALSTIQKHLKLLEVPDEFQDPVARGLISMQVALCLCRIEDPSSLKYYFEAAVHNGITIEVAESWVTEYFKTKSNFDRSEAGGVDGGGLVQESLPIYGTCVCCVGPVEVSKIKYIPVCPECDAQIRGALKPK